MINKEKVKIYHNQSRSVEWVKGTKFSGSKKSVVIVMHDGESIFNAPTGYWENNDGWKMHEIMQKLAIEDYLIFGYASANKQRPLEYSVSEFNSNTKHTMLNSDQTTPRGQQYLKEGVFTNLIPHFEKKLNFKFNDCYRIMIGASLGGQITTYTAIEYPNSFDAFISMSTCLHYNNKAKEYIFSKPIKARYYHDMGGKENPELSHQLEYQLTYQQICEWLDHQRNGNYMCVFDSNGEHIHNCWKERMLLAIPWAMRKDN